jgi:hypothetical protein
VKYLVIPSIIIVALLLAYGIVGQWDYEDARRLECDSYNQAYDVKRDVCYKENQEN